MSDKRKLETSNDYLARYPRVCAHIIAESLGYATPGVAATILKDSTKGRPNFCEWVDACYRGNARQVVEDSIRNRRRHEGYMTSYKLALRIVKRQLENGTEPMFGSWF